MRHRITSFRALEAMLRLHSKPSRRGPLAYVECESGESLTQDLYFCFSPSESQTSRRVARTPSAAVFDHPCDLGIGRDVERRQPGVLDRQAPFRERDRIEQGIQCR